MHWPSLLSRHRLGGPSAAGAGPCSEFQRDFDRIVFSSAFRRLQDKTQVFPLTRNDYVRTRLAPEERADFESFEGNAQTFRILARLGMPDNVGGMQLTCATLGAVAKYPRAAILAELLDALVGAAEAAAAGPALPSARAILDLLPGQFLSADGGPAADPYTRVLAITDFVSGMTDSYAVAIAAKLRALQGRP